MNIKKVEQETGISKQNIRFYEKHGLVNPGRNSENEYREYSEEDVRILKIVKILRKLDMPIEEIKNILEMKIPLSEAMKEHQARLKQKEEELQAAIAFCKTLEKDKIDELDADMCLQEMEKEEERGNVFMSLVKDIIEIDKEEGNRRFSFSPDLPICNKREFTQELLKYASNNNLNMVITKESMYPEFEIDGVEYEAHRIVTRFGAIVECIVKNGEQIEDKKIEPSRRKVLRVFVRIWPMLLLGAFLFFSRIGDVDSMIATLAFTFVFCVMWWAFTRFVPKS